MICVPRSCPSVWSDIAADLSKDFSGCNPRAANAVRFGFHDAGECCRGPLYPEITN